LDTGLGRLDEDPLQPAKYLLLSAKVLIHSAADRGEDAQDLVLTAQCLGRLATAPGGLGKVLVLIDWDLVLSASSLCRLDSCLGRLDEVLSESPRVPVQSAEVLLLSAKGLFMSAKGLFMSAKVVFMSAQDPLLPALEKCPAHPGFGWLGSGV
jgi:hypothetical protein